MKKKFSLLLCLFMLGCVIPTATRAEDPPAAPPVSEFAPAEGLQAQLSSYVADLTAAVESETAYTEKKDRIVRDANTVVVLALALGLHDTENDLKAAAPAVIKAAQAVGAAQDFATAKTAVGELEQAAAGKGETATEEKALTWNEKHARMGQVMKQVTFLHNKLRRAIKRLDAKTKVENAQQAAVLAVIAQAVIADTHEVKDPAQFGEWYRLAGEMRDASSSLRVAIEDQDKAAAEKAMIGLTQSCETCHKAFRVEE